MTRKVIHVAVNGVTGRMGYRQHLVPSPLSIGEQWELFLQSAAKARPFTWDLADGAKAVQLAALALQSSAEGRRVDVPPLAV